jgi:hypothetical protein
MMKRRHFIHLSILTILSVCNLSAQEEHRAWLFTGTVYDEHFVPVPYTSVVGHGTGQGDMTDSMGIFSLYVRATDKLSFYNISFRDTTIYVSAALSGIHLKLKRKVYALPGAMIFNWGSTYSEFIAEVQRQGVQETIGEKLGLPRQDPGVIPFDMDEEKIKSGGFLLNSPVSFIYYNLSRKEKGARRAFRLKQDQALIDRFNRVLGPTNLQHITGLEGKALEDFMIYLNKELTCDYQCSELQLTKELLRIWKKFKEMQEMPE